MKLWEQLASQIGALRARQFTWALVGVFSVWVLLDVFVLKVTGGLAQSSFDAMVRARIYAAAPDPRIVIIDIDEASLSRMSHEFGRWPWPRDTLATVLTHLEQQKPAAILWDVMFADADRLSPGGDAAFDGAARLSLHSHFPVVRLPQANDTVSQLTRKDLPGLWVPEIVNFDVPTSTQKPAAVAMIAPVLPALANGRLGFNNGYVDTDGVLRRYRYLEWLSDGSAIQSLPFSALGAINNDAYKTYTLKARGGHDPAGELIAWRGQVDVYPRISLADVLEEAESGAPTADMARFSDKVIIIGATAPSLHDLHPTPLSPNHAGVDTLATVVDNILNQRHIAELPRWLVAAATIILCAALALWGQFKNLAALAPALLALPGALLGLSYLSLNGFPVFLDFSLAAGLVLVFLAVLRSWGTLRRRHWCAMPEATVQALSIWPCRRSLPWLDGDLDRLIDALEKYAPSCRVAVCDTHVVWPASLRWPELARFAAVIGPHADLLAARQHLTVVLYRLGCCCGELEMMPSSIDRTQLGDHLHLAWARLITPDST